MGASLRSWWQQMKQHRVAIGVVALVLIGVVVIALIIAVVLSNGTGFNGYNKVSTVHTISGPSSGTVTTTEEYQPGKTLWDLLQLLAALAIPVVVGFGVAWFTAQQGKVNDRENKDNQREAALQAYIDKISELLLKEHLGELTADGKLKPEYEQVRNVARVRTITVLTQLDARRIGYVFTFLREAGLMSTTSNDNIVSLSNADLRSVNWSQANLSNANLSRADLSNAKLNDANLISANLSNANLIYADLRNASLNDANLSNADLSYAKLIDADLIDANLIDAKLSNADLRNVELINANLNNANLSGSDLNGAELVGANLNDANLSNAVLSDAKLMLADLTGANLSKANLSNAILDGADLSKADLTEAIVTDEQLEKAQSLKGATMPNGSKYP